MITAVKQLTGKMGAAIALLAELGEVTPRIFSRRFYPDRYQTPKTWLMAGSYLARLRKAGLTEAGAIEGTHKLTTIGRDLAEQVGHQLPLALQ